MTDLETLKLGIDIVANAVLIGFILGLLLAFLRGKG